MSNLWRPVAAGFATMALLAGLLVGLPGSAHPKAARAAANFYNPFGEATDPSIVTANGFYYLIGTVQTPGMQLFIQKSSTLAGLHYAPKTVIYDGSGAYPNLGCCTLWSPVLKFVAGKWYVYFSTTDSAQATWADYVLEGNATDPIGPYTFKANLRQGGNGGSTIIGPGAFQMPSGQIYFTTTTFGFYIQPMTNPWTLSGSMVQIDNGNPTLSWEGGSNEIATAIIHTVGSQTKVFLPYTSENHYIVSQHTGPCWSFCIGMWTNVDGNLLNPGSWTKSPQPVFTGGPDVGLYRLLALTTFKSLDGTEDWIAYNADDTLAKDGTGDFGERDTFAQKFTWNPDGTPNFGRPTPLATAITVPSGETNSPPAIQPGTRIFTDTFESGSAGQWTPLAGAWGICQPRPPNSEYCATGTPENITTAGDSRWGNYTVETSTVITNGPQNGGVDVMGRMQDASHFYELELIYDSAGSRRWVIAINNGGYTSLANGTYNFSTGVRYWLRLDLNEELLTASISTDSANFTPLGTASDTTFSNGKIGLRTWGSWAASFKNVAATEDLPTWGFYSGGGWGGLQINAGSDMAAGSFVGDRYREGGQALTTTTAIDTSGVSLPAPQAVYQSEYWTHSAEMDYIIPSLSPGARYLTRLHFAEIHYTTAGSRYFNVVINGTQVLTNFDKVAAAGAAFKAVERDFVTTANSVGDIQIQFTQGTVPGVDGNPTISGIEVSPANNVIDAGGYVIGLFGTDTGYNGGAILTTSNAIDTSAAGSAPQLLYQSERWSTGSFSYTFSGLGIGSSNLVRLHFAEIYYTSAGQRFFNVLINGNQVLTNFDKVAVAGAPNKAVAVSFLATADSGGNITVTFTPGTTGPDHNPTISGIEIRAFGQGINAGGAAAAPFVADTGYTGGFSESTTNGIAIPANLHAPAPQAVYQTDRWNWPNGGYSGSFTYTIAGLAMGQAYVIRLHFAEIYYTSPGQRDFNIVVNGNQVYRNFDKVAEAGAAFTAIVKEFYAVADQNGNVSLQFTQGTIPGEDGNPTVSGVEVN